MIRPSLISTTQVKIQSEKAIISAVNLLPPNFSYGYNGKDVTLKHKIKPSICMRFQATHFSVEVSSIKSFTAWLIA